MPLVPLLAVWWLVQAPPAPFRPRIEGPFPVEIQGGAEGIGFDDMVAASGLGAILVPAGGTGSLLLLDPKTQTIRFLRGFSSTEGYGGGHDDGVTSADAGGGFLYAVDRTLRRLDVVDPEGGKILSWAPLAAPPDYVRYVETTGEVWVTEPDAEQIEIFRIPAKGGDPPSAAAVVAVPGGPESLVVDRLRGRAYAHLWGGKTVAVDLARRSIVGRWKNGCAGSRGIALDANDEILLTGCAEGRVTAADLARGGAIVSSIRTGKGVDLIAFSPVCRHVYVPSSREGTLAVLGVSRKGVLSRMKTVRASPGAHCVVADTTRQVWVCDPPRGALLHYVDFLPNAKP